MVNAFVKHGALRFNPDKLADVLMWHAGEDLIEQSDRLVDQFAELRADRDCADPLNRDVQIVNLEELFLLANLAVSLRAVLFNRDKQAIHRRAKFGFWVCHRF
jgi:hypothetical protein